MVKFYLDVGATWGVNFNGCGLSRLVCFSESYFAFLRALPMLWRYLGTCCGRKGLAFFNLRIVGIVVLYLCFGGTWVHVMTKKDLLVS